MTIQLKVPAVGESIQEVQIGRWLKQPGDSVLADESLVELETDKASMEVPAPSAGVLTEVLKREGESVSVGEVIAYLEAQSGKQESQAATSPADENGNRKAAAAETTPVRQDTRAAKSGNQTTETQRQEKQDQAAAADKEASGAPSHAAPKPAVPATPSARRALREHGLTADEVPASGKQLRPEDVEQHVEKSQRQSPSDSSAAKPSTTESDLLKHFESDSDSDSDSEQVVPMSLIRRRIAKRLVEAQQTAALLTTFNEIDMSAVIKLREKHRERFLEKFKIKLGFMSFFVKAVIEALKQTPGLNAEIRDGTNIVYRNYFHIGVAIGGGQGLVVPILRHAERMSFAEIEQTIADFAKRARDKQLKPQELEGGTFTISNGGVYGSLLSTPIVNPPQSGVLGMHTIQERPVAREGQVVIRPMMYVALTYDHRIVDGSDAVTFLRRVKEDVEEPAQMLLEV